MKVTPRKTSAETIAGILARDAEQHAGSGARIVKTEHIQEGETPALGTMRSLPSQTARSSSSPATTGTDAMNTPSNCDLCTGPIKDRFVDGRLRDIGQWAYMCPGCHKVHGHGFGIGRGQEFTKQPNGDFVKTKG